MKRLFYFLLPAALLLSCSGSDAGEYVRCKIDGVAYEDLDIGAYISASDLASLSGSFASDSVVLTVNVPNVTTTGTYTINSGTGELNLLYYGTIYGIKSIYPQSHGTLTVSEIGNQSPLPRIRGIFEGVAYTSLGDSLVITEGEYSGW